MYRKSVFFIIVLVASLVHTSKISVKKSQIDVEKGRTAILIWKVRTDITSSNQTIICWTEKPYKQFYIGESDSSNSFIFTLTSDGLEKFSKRINYNTTTTKDLLTFIIKITKIKFSDEHKFTCNYGNDRSTVRLSVVSPITMYGERTFPNETFVKLSNRTLIQIDLCGQPKPAVQWKLDNVISQSEGTKIPDKRCYTYNYTFKIDHQKMCGKKIKYTASGYGKRFTGYTILKFDYFDAQPPTNIQILILQNGCYDVIWNGPNIGACVTSLRYELELMTGNNTAEKYQTSSNRIEICLDNQLTSLRLRAAIHTSVSAWVSTEIVSNDNDDQDATYAETRQRNLIIIFTILSLFGLIVLFVVVCLYHRKTYKKPTTKKSGEAATIKYTSLEDFNHDPELCPLNNDLDSASLEAKNNMAANINKETRDDSEDDEQTDYQIMFPPTTMHQQNETFKDGMRQPYDVNVSSKQYDMLEREKKQSIPSSPLCHHSTTNRNENECDISCTEDDSYYHEIPNKTNPIILYDVIPVNDTKQHEESEFALYDVIPRSKTYDNSEDKRKEKDHLYIDVPPTSKTLERSAKKLEVQPHTDTLDKPEIKQKPKHLRSLVYQNVPSHQKENEGHNLELQLNNSHNSGSQFNNGNKSGPKSNKVHHPESQVSNNSEITNGHNLEPRFDNDQKNGEPDSSIYSSPPPTGNREESIYQNV